MCGSQLDVYKDEDTLIYMILRNPWLKQTTDFFFFLNNVGKINIFRSVQSLSHVRFFVTPMDCSLPVFPVHQQIMELTQTHFHRVGDAIQPSHPLSSPSPLDYQSFPASESFLVSQFFTSGGQSTGVSASASVLPMNIQD